MQTVSLRLLFSNLYPETLKTLAPPLPMKDRPLPASIGSVYVPPHQRLRSATTAASPLTNFSPLTNIDSKNGTGGNNSSTLVKSSTVNNQYPYLFDLHELQQKKQEEMISQLDSRNGVVSEQLSSRQVESLTQPGASMSDNIDAWKWKLMTLIRDKDKQELISREKKDRRDYEQIASLARQMGLHCCLYVRVLVVSKTPLPKYRFDLDDKRPQREVTLPSGLEGKINMYLKEYLSLKSQSAGGFQNQFPRSNSNDSIATDEVLFEQPEPQPHNKAAVEKIMWKRSMQLYTTQKSWQESTIEGQKMLEFRKGLPAYKEKDAILNSISKNQVVIISGETGCGKTTQIPQFILESEIESVNGALCNIICTQPRRISAISVSERVAAERGEQLGESVGYKVRLEGVKGRDTHLLFCTTGILLRRLLVDRNLKGVTHVIVDEIHERGINEDFLLIVLKDMLPHRPELRLILMSATLDAELFSSYFGGAPVVRIPGFTYPVQAYFLENILEMTGYRLTPHNQIDDYGLEKTWRTNKQTPRKRKSQIASAVEDSLRVADYKGYSTETQESLTCWNPDSLGFNLIEYLLCNICENEKPGAVLVFMTGWEDISALKDKLQLHPMLGDTNQVLLLPCHGSMATIDQKLIFEKPEGDVRKIILATNIAETSITIDDVVFVIDCGKAKESSYDALNNTPCLLPCWISKVSAQQRRGRAGRVQPGECFHLYPRCVFDAFANYQLPEILRTPLQSLCLQIKSLELGSISEFLSRALQSPELLAVQNAIEYLKIIGALDDNENLTVLGRYLTKLPVEPKLGKMLILGAIFNCLGPILTVVAGLSVRDPFLTPIEKKDLAEAAKAQFSHDYSDHLALVHAYEGWKNAEIDLAGYEYCWKNFLSAQSMKSIDSLREEFYFLLRDTGLVDSNSNISNVWSYDEYLLRAVICYGLYPGVCSIVHNEKSFTLKSMEDGQVNLYSNSVNARSSTIPYPWLVFNEKIKVNSVYLRDSTAISDSALLLFGGSISEGDMDGHLKMLGGYLEFFMNPATAKMYQCLRKELEELIQSKLLNPRMDLHTQHALLSAMRLLLAEDQCGGKFVFNRMVVQNPSKPLVTVVESKSLVSRTESGPGGDNPKSQLQMLLARAGNSTPVYKSKQLDNNQFQSTVEFNGVQITGKPCSVKKQAEKDAAAEALDWLMGQKQMGREYIDQMSMMLKKSKKDHN